MSLLWLFQFLTEVRESALAEDAEHVTENTAAVLMICNRVAGLYKLTTSLSLEQWTAVCNKVKIELHAKVCLFTSFSHSSLLLAKQSSRETYC